MTTAAERRMDDLNPQNLANTAWAFLTVGIHTSDLMKKFSTATSKLIEQFDPVDLLKFLWGYAWAGDKKDLWAKAVGYGSGQLCCIARVLV